MSNPLTDPIKDGSLSFRDFALRGARFLSPLAHMAGLPLDAPIPDFFPTPQTNAEAVVELERRLAELQALDDNMAEAESTREYAATMAAHLGQIETAKALLLKYNTMLNDVQAWTPPTADHQVLKDHLVQQLVSAISHDCDPNQWNVKIMPIPGPAWRDAQIAQVKDRIAFHRKAQAEDEQHTAWKIEWVRRLKESLP